MSKRVITINRMLGSNGRLIGKALAEELGFAFYDKELIDIAAQKENIPFDLLAKVDEKRGSQWRFPIDHELQMDSDFHFVPMNDVLFDLQRKIILDAAEKEDCVIVGRCANHILDNRCLSVFIHAPFEYRVQTVIFASFKVFIFAVNIRWPILLSVPHSCHHFSRKVFRAVTYHY